MQIQHFICRRSALEIATMACDQHRHYAIIVYRHVFIIGTNRATKLRFYPPRKNFKKARLFFRFLLVKLTCFSVGLTCFFLPTRKKFLKKSSPVFCFLVVRLACFVVRMHTPTCLLCAPSSLPTSPAFFFFFFLDKAYLFFFFFILVVRLPCFIVCLIV